MDILNHFNLKLVSVGIIYQKLEEVFATALLDVSNHFFGLTTASDTVIISCDLSKQTGTIDGFEIIHIMKWHYDCRKRNVLKNL